MKLFALIALACVATVRASPTGLLETMNRHKTDGFTGKQWVLLIAGSNTYDNYRHQADICHSFQVLKNHGIPEEQIVVMMYDDIANSDENPFPGTIINKPGGKDVYHGVPKDYIGDDVTPDNAIKILNGDKALKAQGKKVIESTDQDHVFIYFADHGATGLVAFPNDELDADTLNNALKQLYKDKRYAKLVLYVEACESGSMFDGLLPKNINIYATTAANPDESSYACYWDDDRQTYLGDVYSVNWIEDSDARSSLASETLDGQFKLVKRETNTSHVMKYGDTTIGTQTLDEFQGDKKAGQFDSHRVKITDAIKSSDVPLVRAFRKIGLAKTEEERAAATARANQIVDGRVFLINQVKKLAKTIAKKHSLNADDLVLNKRKLTQHKCAKELYKSFDMHCFDISKHTYTMRHLYVLANVCEQINQSQLDDVVHTIAHHCYTTQNIHEHNYVIV